MTEDAKPQKGYDYIGPPTVFQLDHACYYINKAFGATCYLVGSALHRPDFRDVDVRLIVGNDKWVHLFGPHHLSSSNAFWSLLCTSISMYLSNAIGLRVDFQIQSMKMANGAAHGDKPRHPLGIFSSEAPWTNIGLLSNDNDVETLLSNTLGS